MLCLPYAGFFLKYVLVYTQPTKIWREKGTKQIRILVWCLRNWGYGAGSKKAGKEKFWKHNNPKNGQQIYDLAIIGKFSFIVVSSQQNPMYERIF